MTAAERVFGIAELLEQILLYLPFKWLLLSQRTSKTFQAALTTSLPLRRKLYLEPSTAKSKPELAPFFSDCDKISNVAWTAPTGFTYQAIVTAGTYGQQSESIARQPRIHGEDFLRPKFVANWRNMLITQPPIDYLVFDLWTLQTKHWYLLEPRKAGGLRWRDVIDKAAIVHGRDRRGVSVLGAGRGNLVDVYPSSVEWS